MPYVSVDVSRYRSANANPFMNFYHRVFQYFTLK